MFYRRSLKYIKIIIHPLDPMRMIPWVRIDSNISIYTFRPFLRIAAQLRTLYI
nr:MAG TPA: hypothetical protein [Bacteriophage sp.]